MATMSIIMFALKISKVYKSKKEKKKRKKATIIQFYPNNCWKSCSTWILGTPSRPLHLPSGRKGKSAAILPSYCPSPPTCLITCSNQPTFLHFFLPGYQKQVVPRPLTQPHLLSLTFQLEVGTQPCTHCGND